MFTIMQGKVIRTQVFGPPDEAFRLQPGIEAAVHVPEIPDRTFPGKVTRIADRPGGAPILKPYLMVRPIFRAYVLVERPHRALPPEAVSRWPQSGRRTPRLKPPSKTGCAVRLF